MHVLCIEDDAGLLYLLRKSLEAANFVVTEALNGEEGLQLLQEEGFDAIVIDQEMPMMTGLEVIQRIKLLEYTGPIVMVTGAGNEEVAVEAMRLGANDYLVKDTNLGYLKILPSVIHQVIHERQLVEAHQAAEQALLLEKARSNLLSQFIRDASHEFRTPLTVIQTSCHLLSRISEEAKRQTYIQRIQEQSDVILNLVDRLVQLARLDNTSTLNFVPVELNDLLDNLIKRKEELITAKQLQLNLDFPEEGVSVLADPIELTDALAELVTNACRYSNVESVLEITLHYDNKEAVIGVHDTGIGMNDEQLSHIFERFYRVDDAHSTRGFGLGLSIAARIIDLHHGEIIVTSELGKGTSVVVKLPLKQN